jgi:hypothetical protein
LVVDFLSVAAGIFGVVRIFLWRAISLSLLGTIHNHTQGRISSQLGASVLAGRILEEAGRILEELGAFLMGWAHP